jgi:SAM-dependent methyltransferase
MSAARSRWTPGNAAFWNELCGSELARRLGITDFSKDALRKFDDWYMKLLSLSETVTPAGRGKRQRYAGGRPRLWGDLAEIEEAGANYRGLDIAENPVGLVRYRFRKNNLRGEATKGSMLNCPSDDERFDWLIAVGCFHHTGNLQCCLDESWRVLRPGGTAMIMVHNVYSYRRWQSVTCRNNARDLPRHYLVARIRYWS